MSTGIGSFIVILAYLFILLGVSIYSYRSQKVKNVEGFFLANRGVSAALLPLTMIAAMQSTFAFVGAPGMYYMHGIGFIVLVLSQGWVALMVIYFGSKISKLGRKYGYMTIGDFFQDRYDSKYIKAFSALVSVLMTVVFLAMQYVGSARAISILSNNEVPYIVALLVIAGFSLFYVLIGGAKSVVLTDAVQAIILLSGIVIAACIATIPAGGIGNLFKSIAETEPVLFTRIGAKGNYTDKNWIMQFIVLPFGIWLCPHVWIRSLMAKDEKALVTSALSIPVSQIVIYATSTLLIGLSGHVLLGKIDVADNVLPLLMNKYTNWVVAAIVIAASIAAGVSTINSMVLVSSQILSQDVVKLLSKKERSDEQGIRLSRILTLIIIVVGVIIAIKPPQSLVTVVTDVAYTGLAQLAPAFILGLFWKKVNKTGAAIGMTTGVIILFATRIAKVSPLGFPGFLWAFFINIALTVGISLVTPSTNKERLDKIFTQA